MPVQVNGEKGFLHEILGVRHVLRSELAAKKGTKHPAEAVKELTIGGSVSLKSLCYQNMQAFLISAHVSSPSPFRAKLWRSHQPHSAVHYPEVDRPL